MKNNLSMVMGEKKIKTAQLCRDTGISRNTISGIYHDRSKNIRLDTLIKLCDYLQVSLSQLIEYVPSKKEDV